MTARAIDGAGNVGLSTPVVVSVAQDADVDEGRVSHSSIRATA
jgi:hypothetical protein